MADDNSVSTNTNQSQPATAPVDAQAGATLAGTPDTWPGAFGIYKYSRQAFLHNGMTIVLLWLISLGVTLVLSIVFSQIDKNLGDLVSNIVSVLFTVAVYFAMVHGVRREKISVGDSINKSLPLWVNMILLTILIIAACVVSLLLLVIPFFFVAPRLALAPYYLIDKKLGPIDAFKASWDNSKGHVSKVYGIVGATICMILLMITIIGIPFSIYFLIMYSAAFAVLYEFVIKHGNSQPSAPAPTPPAN